MASTLPTHKLGRHGPQVTACGFGLMGLSALYGPPKSDEERLAVLDRAYDLGERNWDSSDFYGDNELLLAKWFRLNPGKRENIFLATKFAMRKKPDGSLYIDSSPEWAPQACETSLQRLGIDCVDLYYCHRINSQTPIEKTVEAMSKLKEQGKIKYLGLSECSADTLRRACKVHHIDAVQIEYSPFSLDIESDQIGLLKACRELGVAIVAYAPIGRGMLSGKLRSRDDFAEGDFRRTAPRYSEENFPKNLKMVDQIVELAKKKGCTPAQLTLAWILAQGNDFIPIPGTTNANRLEENVGSMQVKLTEAEVQEIRHVAENANVSGGRYLDFLSGTLFVTTVPLSS